MKKIKLNKKSTRKLKKAWRILMRISNENEAPFFLQYGFHSFLIKQSSCLNNKDGIYNKILNVNHLDRS
jgi:hypothetical protein